MQTKKTIILLCSLLSLIVALTTFTLLNWKASLALTSFTFFISLAFTLTLIEKNVRQVTLEINSGNKDRELPLSYYENEIENFFFLLRYKKVTNGYLPTGLGRIQSNKVTISKNQLSFVIEGPESIITILCDNLKTPGASFACIKKEDLGPSS